MEKCVVDWRVSSNTTLVCYETLRPMCRMTCVRRYFPLRRLSANLSSLHKLLIHNEYLVKQKVEGIRRFNPQHDTIRFLSYRHSSYFTAKYGRWHQVLIILDRLPLGSYPRSANRTCFKTSSSFATVTTMYHAWNHGMHDESTLNERKVVREAVSCTR